MATTITVGLQLIKNKAFQVGVHVADARHPHVGHKPRRYLVLHGAYAPDELQLLHMESTMKMAISRLRPLERSKAQTDISSTIDKLLHSAKCVRMNGDLLKLIK